MNIVSFSKQETASLLFSGGIQFFLDLPFLVLVTAYLLELGPHKNRGEACPSVCVLRMPAKCLGVWRSKMTEREE